MHCYAYGTTHEAYSDLLRQVILHPDYVVAPRGQAIHEQVDVVFTVEKPTSEAIVTHDRARNVTIEAYAKREFQLYANGTRLAKDFATASSFWSKLVNPDNETINSAYGWLIWKDHSYGDEVFEEARTGVAERKRTPWCWCVEALKADKDTRQAVLKFSKREHFYLGNKDLTCTLHGQFMIRDDKLNLSMVLRSNDLHKGLVYDISWFCHLQDLMLGELLAVYPTLTKGSYTHHAHSLHVYDKDLESCKAMAGIVGMPH